MTFKQVAYTSLLTAVVVGIVSIAYRPNVELSFRLGESCVHPQYTVRTLSYDPLILHIENFLTPQEAKHFLEITQSNFTRSLTRSRDGQFEAVKERTSSSAYLPPDDPVVHCVRSRAAEFQGYVDLDMMERLQVTRYLEGEQYMTHYDWWKDPAARNLTTNRETTFFAVLDAECDSCGTRFPNILVNWDGEDKRWCKIVDCAAEYELIVRPIPGNAVFWRNLYTNGSGDPRTLHAGLPAVGGRKVGLNIWTRREVL